MRAPKPPGNESERLAQLRDYDVLDTLPEGSYDAIVQVAAAICQVPIALISLVDENRQWFKARHGLDAPETPRDVSFCGHVVEHSSELVVEDALEDERFADNPLVVGDPGIRFYAGAPLETDGGLVMGTLCVIDRAPRSLSEEQRASLRSMSRVVMDLLRLRLEVKERKRAQAESDRLREKAERADSAKSQFLATMSHELRTPLNAVIGFSRLLCKNKHGNLTASDLRFAERIRENGTHLLNLINEVLDISKIEAGQMTYQREPVSVESVVDAVVRLQEGLAGEKGLGLAVDMSPGLVPIIADQYRLRQVLINLVGNAIKFTERGEITLRVVCHPETRRVRSIEVADTGIGISAEDIERVFTPFEQVDGETTRSYAGTGLGLTISRSMCAGMGLTLEVESEPGRGSTFRVVVPPGVSEPDAVACDELQVGSDSHATTPGRRRVLVVDDNADARHLLGEQLRELDCEVREARDGAECLRVTRSWIPDLVTLDLMMPNTNGWQVLKELRDSAGLADVPVVVISMVADESRATLLGAFEVLRKPVEREDLLRIVRSLSPPHRRALVVEDNRDARMLLSNILEDEGWEVAEAVNGAEGLSALERFAPDVVVLDLMMPVMDGAQFLERLRGQPQYRDLPVVVVTAKELGDRERTTLLSKASAVLGKTSGLTGDLQRLLAEIASAPALPA